MSVIGDKLGQHELLGFTTTFRHNTACRICLANKIIRSKQVSENKNLLRKKINYKKHSREKSHGVTKECVFNDLKNYYIIDNVPVDCMHDLYEGVCRYIIPKILYNLIKIHKYFSIYTLNFTIKNFDHGSSYGLNIPPEIKIAALKKGSLIISASEMKTLIKYLGCYVGGLIPQENRE